MCTYGCTWAQPVQGLSLAIHCLQRYLLDRRRDTRQRRNPTSPFVAAPETQRKTTLGSWRTGDVLNLEPALAFGDRLGGHLVSGHVDGIGTFVSKTPEGDGFRMNFSLPKDGSVKVVEKGSIAIDGISLTTWDCRADGFSVAVIPHTLQHTSLGSLRPGNSINLEMDPQIARWVEKMLPA